MESPNGLNLDENGSKINENKMNMENIMGKTCRIGVKQLLAGGASGVRALRLQRPRVGRGGAEAHEAGHAEGGALRTAQEGLKTSRKQAENGRQASKIDDFPLDFHSIYSISVPRSGLRARFGVWSWRRRDPGFNLVAVSYNDFDWRLDLEVAAGSWAPRALVGSPNGACQELEELLEVSREKKLKVCAPPGRPMGQNLRQRRYVEA